MEKHNLYVNIKLCRWKCFVWWQSGKNGDRETVLISFSPLCEKTYDSLSDSNKAKVNE